MSRTFAVYLVGYVVLICGLAYAADLAHVPPHWIIAGVIVLLGLGIIKALKLHNRTTQKKTTPDA